MKRFWLSSLFGAVLASSGLAATPAVAQVSISVGVPGIGFSYSSGGYCDSWGCPGEFWNYPIYYCPVYYGNRWYRGPVYYRSSGGARWYWIHGGWRRDAWFRPRPSWACVDRYGPPLDLDFYIWNGFYVRDSWRYNWYRYRNDWWRHRQDWDRRYNNDTRWRSWLPAQQQRYDWNRERNWNATRDWTGRDWNRADWERRNGITRPVQTLPTVTPPATTRPVVTRPVTTRPEVTRPVTTRPADNTGRNRGRGRGGAEAPTVSPPPTNNQPSDNRGRNRDRSRGGPNQGGAMAPTAPSNNPPPDRGRNRDRFGGGGERGDQGGAVAPRSEMAPRAPRNNQPTNEGSGDRGRKDKGKGKDNSY